MSDRATHLQEATRLLMALRGARLPTPADADLAHQMLRAAQFHGIAPTLLRAYTDRRAPELDALRTHVNHARARALLLTATATEVSAHLRANQIPYALVKGPIVALAYPDCDRSFADIDVLVAPARMTATIAALAELGAEVLDEQGWPRDDGVGELALGLSNGVTIDLHADLIHRAQVRRDFRWPTEPLLERAVTVDLLGAPVRTLTTEDHLIYVALHGMLSGGHRLVWLADLDAMVRRWAPRWDVVVDRARRAKLALVLGVMLQRTVDLLGTPVPSSVTRDLTRGGRGWSGLLREMERRNRIAACHGPYRTGQFAVRATRRSSLTSAAALTAMIGREMVGPYLSEPRVNPLAPRQPRQP